VLNTEARTVDADVLSRRCVLMRLLDFSYEHYQKALRQSAGAVVIILPRAMAAVPQDVVRVSLCLSPHACPSGCICWVSLSSPFRKEAEMGRHCGWLQFPERMRSSQQFMEIEPEMLAMETVVPVYFAVEDEALLSIYEQTQAASASQGSASAAEGKPGHWRVWGGPGPCIYGAFLGFYVCSTHPSCGPGHKPK
jgi:hypothetical protein